MKRGLIGYPLSHSYSPIIHEKLGSKKYNLYSLNENEFESFLINKDFDCLNVTIPYKEKCIEYIDELCPVSKELKSVNCIKNINGKLYGYNTDYYGFLYLLNKKNINLKDKTVAILGSGGSCKSIKKVLEDIKCKKIYIVSRVEKENCITYEQLYNLKIDCIINTTPIGMYPNSDKSIIDISKFNNVSSVIDIIYNPFNTKLLVEAKLNNKKIVSGLDMLVAQAVYSYEIFENIKLDEKLIDIITKDLLNKKQNIVLIGMPASGKTTIGQLLAKELGYEFIDTDILIETSNNIKIKNLLKNNNEKYFRELEKNVVKSLENKYKTVISTGGGIVKNIDNIKSLMKNGLIIFLDRKLENLVITEDRVLSNSFDKLEKMYAERIHLYKKYSDFIIENNDTIKSCLEKIKGILK